MHWRLFFSTSYLSFPQATLLHSSFFNCPAVNTFACISTKRKTRGGLGTDYTQDRIEWFWGQAINVWVVLCSQSDLTCNSVFCRQAAECMFCFSLFPCRVDEESSKRSELEKLKREMENQIEELKEDLDSEKSARTKAEKQRRELGEVMESVWTKYWVVGAVVKVRVP